MTYTATWAMFLQYSIMEFAIFSSLSFVVVSNVGNSLFFTMVNMERAYPVLPCVFLTDWSALSKQSGMLVLDKWGCLRYYSKDRFNHHPLPSLLMDRRCWCCQLLYWCWGLKMSEIYLQFQMCSSPCAGLPWFATLWFLHGQLIFSSCSRQVSV